MKYFIEVQWQEKKYRLPVTAGFEVSNPFFVVHSSGKPRFWFKKLGSDWVQFACVTPLPVEQQKCITDGLDELLRTTKFEPTTKNDSKS